MNLICVGMVTVRVLVEPLTKLMNKLTSTHVHGAPLKDIGEEHAGWVEFEQYFKRLAASDEKGGRVGDHAAEGLGRE